MNLLRLGTAAFLLVSVSGLAAACSSSDDSAGGDCSSYGSALVSYMRRCSTGTGYEDARWNEYQTRFQVACGSALSLPGTGINGGFLSRCANALRGAACGTQTSDLPECDTPAGTLADGAQCVSSDQCQSESCAKATGSNCGTCQPRVPVGGACTTTTRCVKDAYCDTSSGKCVANTKSPVGGPCDSTKGQSCDSTGYCDYATKTCKARAKAGEPCGAALCDTGLTCDYTGTKTCIAPKTVGEGEACGTGATTCSTGLQCSAGKCVKILWVKPGGDCSALGSRCEHGSCGATSKKCPTVVADGGACGATVPDSTCDDFASCIDGKCTLPGQVVCK